MYLTKLVMTRAQFVAIYELLKHVRLGDRNIYEKELTDLMIMCEEMESEDVVNKFLDDTDYSHPSISIEASDEDGVVINILE